MHEKPSFIPFLSFSKWHKKTIMSDKQSHPWVTNSQMHTPERDGGPHHMYLLFITFNDHYLGPHFLAGSDRTFPVPLGLREEVAISLEKCPVPGAAAAQAIYWGKRVRLDLIRTAPGHHSAA
jgi:hypothetical protein